MYKKILVASDLSPSSEQALRTAIALARALGAQVIALHVIDAPYESRKWFLPGSPEMQKLRAALLVEEDTVRAQVEAQIKAVGGEGVMTRIEICHGIATDEIVAQAARLSAELIVMGTHGRRGLQHAIMGSVAERVVRTASQPVLTVRAAVAAASAS